MTGCYSVAVTFPFQGWEKQSDRVTKECQSNCVFQPLKIPMQCGGWRNFVSGGQGLLRRPRRRRNLTRKPMDWLHTKLPQIPPGPDRSAPVPHLFYPLVSSWTYFTLIALLRCFKSPLNESQACLLHAGVECSLLFCFAGCCRTVRASCQQHYWVFL